VLPLVVEEGVGEPLLSLPGVGIVRRVRLGMEGDRCQMSRARRKVGKVGKCLPMPGKGSEAKLVFSSTPAELVRASGLKAPPALHLTLRDLTRHYAFSNNETRSTEESLHEHLSNTLHRSLRHCFKLRSIPV
jgi:hypothetical protein